MSVAVLSPHLDDAVLSAWSALRDGRDALVVNVFDGIPPGGTLGRWDRITGASDSSVRMHERLAEDEAAMAVAGARSESLGFLENQYRTRPPEPDRLAAALAEAVAGHAEVWAPAGIGGHTDHAIVRDWALVQARDGACVRLYADLPYAARQGWPSWVTGIEPDPHFSHDLWWERHLPAGVELAPAAHRLVDTEAELKLSALDVYRSQIYALDGGPVGLLRNPLVIGHEVSWAVLP